MDPRRIENFVQQVVADQGAVFGSAMTYLGDRLGLYRAMAGAGPLTIAELAERTGCAPRYLQEWLASQAAAGYVEYADGAYDLPDEHAAVLADEQSPAAVVGGFAVAAAVWAGAERLAAAFRTGEGMAWGEHATELFEGTERFYAAGYRAALVSQWIPALDGVEDALRAGGRVLDVGCGHGAAPILLATAFPQARVVGVDAHAPSVDEARKRAAEAGVGDRVTFEVAGARDHGGRGFDLVCFFDTLHDLGEPVAAVAEARAALAPNGAVMIVEPRAGDRLEDNLHPLGRLFYAASTALCTANALSQHDGPHATALGAQAGPARLREVLNAGGLSRVRVAAETPVNLVLEARP